ncbi:MAG: SusC/RagA family TonB-linked outer membrane protein [Bacteroidetes bacterium HGW-Bacteroidetes-5]|jgi:TonB-linked SusC/RagA family outer membrane protein|nr:MAG: SusC/RagA family TonB-linked outer membrane protein [Bacteroidetes bacterium HGW-Bacteroidetes-5]
MHVSRKRDRIGRKVLLVFALLLFAGTIWAQNIKVSGLVTDDKGQPVIGANVLVQGTRTGAAADLDGKFVLNIPGNAVLEISAIGYEKQTIQVRNRTSIRIELREDALLLEEAVVVGEFGVKRAARAVGGAVESVRGAEIAESGRENFVTALQGRVSGVQITNSTGTPGASSSVLIRGATSISGNNNPLYVIDGIPMNNSTFNPVGNLAVRTGGSETVADRNLDFSNRGSDINPEDIESMTILKGAAAAALYGSDASNGAIIITTKKGKKGKGVVSYSNLFRFDKAYRYPELQTEFDNGMYGVTNYYTTRKYGAPYLPGTKLYDNLKNFFQTGVTQRHNVSFEAGNEFMTFRSAASTTNQTGIVPTSDYTRTNVTVSGTAKLNNWLNVETSLQYAGTTNNKVSKGSGGPLERTMIWPLTDDMRVYLNEAGQIRYPNNYSDGDILNPYFDLYKNVNYDENERFITNLALNFTPFKDFLIRGQVGMDISNTTIKIVRHPDWSYNRGGTGSYDEARVAASNPSINILASYKKDFGKFSANIQFGYHQQESANKTLSVKGEKFLVREFQSIANCDITTLVSRTNDYKRRLQAVSGAFEMSYNNMAFLTFRARNDWSSTLPMDNNRYFYPGVEASFIVSDLPFFKTRSETFSYLKLRGSVAQVGKDAPPLSIYPALETTSTTAGGYRYGFTGPNLSLRPEMNTAWEVGLEGRLFRNRLDFDVAYYNTLSEDQIITSFRMSYATGFVLNNMNVGSFKTSGVEMRIGGDIIKNRDLIWNVSVNWSKNWSNVVSLPENVTEYYNPYTWVSGNIRNGIKVGFPITSITGNDFQKNANGQVLIDPSSGLPLTSGAWTVLGDREPDLKFGFMTTLKYKAFSISALLDGRLGATMVNGTKRIMMTNGYSLESVEMRKAGPVVFDGVLNDGNQNTETPTINNIAVKLGDIQYGYAGADPNWIETGVNYLRLGEVRLNYNVDRKWLAKATKGVISAASVFATGTDLLVWTNYSGIDVVGNSNSASLGGTGGVGFDMMAIAAPRGLSFGVNITF